MPSLGQFEGGAYLALLIGEESRVSAKYGARAIRLLLLEAGHLMQNLCLVSTGIGCSTLPLGGFFEGAVAAKMELPRTDTVLYVGAIGIPL